MTRRAPAPFCVSIACLLLASFLAPAPAVHAAATCFGEPATKTGSGVITGTPGKDVIYASNGGEIIHGDEGNDIIHGDEGDDILSGDDGDADECHGDGGLDVADDECETITGVP